MRNQIKKMIKKENGFTLVELLAVLVILGIIVAIAIPAVGNIVENAEGKADSAQTELVIDAARLYDVEKDIDPTDGVTVQTLIDEGYLDVNATSNISRTSAVKVTESSTTKEKTYTLE